jgi:hypothetical protein
LELAQELERRAAAEESPFRAQLMREDAARARSLALLARSARDRDAFLEQGRRLGWTQGDARTAELAPALTPFLEAVHELEGAGAGAEGEARVLAAWRELWRLRMERLIGCLSTPPVRPEG